MVADGSPDVEDLTEDIDQQIATLISNNRHTSDWDFITYDDEFSVKGRGEISGINYWITSSNIIVQVF